MKSRFGTMPHTTLREWLSEAPFTLVLSSSFFGTTLHCGVLSALLEAGLEPSAVTGSSAGAIVGTLWSAGLSMQTLVDELTSSKPQELMCVAKPWREPGGLLSSTRIRSEIERILQTHGACETLEDCRVPTRVSTFDVTRLRTRVVRQGSIADAVTASMCVPGMFAPFWLDGRPFLDGGVLDMPGIAETGERERLLYHHATAVPLGLTPLHGATHYTSSVTLKIEQLPILHPFNFPKRGREAFEMARRAARSALEHPVSCGEGAQRVTVGARPPTHARL